MHREVTLVVVDDGTESIFGGDDSAGRSLVGGGVLVSVYQRLGRTLDDLPYTSEFGDLLVSVGREGEERAVLSELQRLRKAGRLPRLGRSKTHAVRLSDAEESLLMRLVEDTAGSVGRRDSLPYTPAFQGVLDAFNERSGRSLDHHTLWRLIARLAK